MSKLKDTHKAAAAKGARRKETAAELGLRLAGMLDAKACDEKQALALIRRGACPDAKNGDGDPVLVTAARRNLVSVAKALLEKGADVNAPCDRGQTALLVCSYKGHAEIAAMLLARGADPNITDDVAPLNLASRYGYTEIVKGLIAQGARLDVRDDYGKTALNRAAYAGYPDIVEALINKGADINIPDDDGRTPLMSTGITQAHRDYVGPDRKLIRVAELLLAADAKMTPQDGRNRSAGDIAAANGHKEIAELIHDKAEKNDRTDLAQGLPLREALKVGRPLRLKV